MKARVAFVILATVVLSAFSFLQKSNPETGLVFQTENYHDAVWHLALMNSVSQSIPPENPLASGERLVGYHYFNDVLWVMVSKLTGISFLTLYMKVSPVLLAFLFSFTTLLIFQKIFAEKIVALLGASITILGSGFAYIVPIFSPLAKAGQSVFWLDQPIHLAINQQLLFSLAIFNIVLILFFSSYKKYWLLIALLSGAVVAIKVYAAMVLLFGLGALGVLQLMLKKKFGLLRIALVASVVAFPFVLLIGNRQGIPFLWEPGWFLKTMFESGERLNWPRWEMIRLDAEMNQNLLRLMILWSGAFVIFFVGNFGVKILGLAFIPVLLKDKKQRSFWLLLGIMCALCLAMPLLFLQKGVVWNTIQFLPYCFVPFGLLLTKGIDQYVPKKWKVAVLSILLILALPTTVQTLWIDLQPGSYTYFSPEFVKELQKLSQVPEDKTLLLSVQLDKNSLVPALSGRPVYFADQSVLSITGNSYEERRAYVEQVELGRTICKPHEVFVSLTTEQKMKIEQCPRRLTSELE